MTIRYFIILLSALLICGCSSRRFHKMVYHSDEPGMSPNSIYINNDMLLFLERGSHSNRIDTLGAFHFQRVEANLFAISQTSEYAHRVEINYEQVENNFANELLLIVEVPDYNVSTPSAVTLIVDSEIAQQSMTFTVDSTYSEFRLPIDFRLSQLSILLHYSSALYADRAYDLSFIPVKYLECLNWSDQHAAADAARYAAKYNYARVRFNITELSNVICSEKCFIEITGKTLNWNNNTYHEGVRI